MAELYKLTATEAAALMEKNEISSEDLVRACLVRIEEREETIRELGGHFADLARMAL